MLRQPLVTRYVVKRLFSLTSSMQTIGQIEYENNKIGLREVVGFGTNGQPTYIDSPMFPYPAIRFQEISPCFKALKEKEKGDWRSLSVEEKKQLYRISFCQTFAEMNAPSGEWKSIVGIGLSLLSLGMCLHIIARMLTIGPLPDSFKEEHRTAKLQRMLAFKVNPITGLASKYDYDNEKWKD